MRRSWSGPGLLRESVQGRRSQRLSRRVGVVPRGGLGRDRRGLQQQGPGGVVWGSSAENQAIPSRKRLPTSSLSFLSRRVLALEYSVCKHGDESRANREPEDCRLACIQDMHKPDIRKERN